MTQKNPRFSVNPEYERILLKILTIDDNEDDNLLVNLTGNGYWTGLAI